MLLCRLLLLNFPRVEPADEINRLALPGLQVRQTGGFPESLSASLGAGERREWREGKEGREGGGQGARGGGGPDHPAPPPPLSAGPGRWGGSVPLPLCARAELPGGRVCMELSDVWGKGGFPHERPPPPLWVCSATFLVVSSLSAGWGAVNYHLGEARFSWARTSVQGQIAFQSRGVCCAAARAVGTPEQLKHTTRTEHLQRMCWPQCSTAQLPLRVSSAKQPFTFEGNAVSGTLDVSACLSEQTLFQEAVRSVHYISPEARARVYCLQSQNALGVSPPPPGKEGGRTEEGQIQVQFYLGCTMCSAVKS